MIYNETFGYFSKCCSHHEWNEAWLLAINMVYTKYFTGSQTTQDLGSWEIT